MTKFFITLLFFILIVPLSYAFAWMPMLAWNNSVHQIFPSIFPLISYNQAFWLMLLFGVLFGQPTTHGKD